MGLDSWLDKRGDSKTSHFGLWGIEVAALHIFINYRQQQKNELMYHQTKGMINGQKKKLIAALEGVRFVSTREEKTQK